MESTQNPTADNGDEIESWIAHHATYIDETKQILSEYKRLGSFDAVKDRVVEDNILNKDTDYYRKNIIREVARRYIPDKGSYVETPLIRTITSDASDGVKEWALYYEFSQDPLVNTVTKEFLFQKYKAGTLTLKADDVEAFIDSLAEEHPEIEEWSESTVEEASSKYLSAMKNFGLLTGRQTKEFDVFFVPDEAVAYVLYRLYERGVTAAADLIANDEWRLLLFDEEDVRRRLTDITPRYVTYERRGSTERVEPVFDSIDEVVDEFDA